MPTVRLHPEAEDEYERAYGWYMERSERAAERFEAAVDKALDDIAGNPGQYPLLDRRHHFHPLERFPYHIVYRIADEEVHVIAIAHGRRRSRYWNSRK